MSQAIGGATAQSLAAAPRSGLSAEPGGATTARPGAQPAAHPRRDHMPAAAAARTRRAQTCPDPTRPAPAQPRRVSFDLDAELTAARSARELTCTTLLEWQMAGLAGTAEIIVSELVANAVKHGPAGPGRAVIRLVLALNAGELTILVIDGHPDVPRARHPDEDGENGRGLVIVEALSTRWGWSPLGNGIRGKAVWAVIPADLDAAGAPAAARDNGSRGVCQPPRRGPDQSGDDRSAGGR